MTESLEVDGSVDGLTSESVVGLDEVEGGALLTRMFDGTTEVADAGM